MVSFETKGKAVVDFCGTIRNSMKVIDSLIPNRDRKEAALGLTESDDFRGSGQKAGRMGQARYFITGLLISSR